MPGSARDGRGAHSPRPIHLDFSSRRFPYPLPSASLISRTRIPPTMTRASSTLVAKASRCDHHLLIWITSASNDTCYSFFWSIFYPQLSELIRVRLGWLVPRKGFLDGDTIPTQNSPTTRRGFGRECMQTRETCRTANSFLCQTRNCSVSYFDVITSYVPKESRGAMGMAGGRSERVCENGMWKQRVPTKSEMKKRRMEVEAFD